MAGNNNRGSHRRRAERVTIAGAIPVAITIAFAGAGIATAAPEQPGLGGPTSQPGVPDFDAVPEAPAVAPEPTPEPPKSYWVAPPVEYDNVPTRPVPTYDNTEYVAPIQIEQLHLPVAVEAVAPIEAPKDDLRLGDFGGPRPNWMSKEYRDRTVNSAAVIEAQYNTFWRSVGVDANRSDRIAAATIGSAAAGALGGAAAVGVPVAVGGALIGGTIGGNIGTAVGGFVTAPIAGVGAIPTGVAGTAAGAAIGAAVGGIPAALVGGVGGGLAGAAAGTAFGAGDSNGEPRELVLPNAPEPDTAALTADTAAQFGQLQAQQPAAATVVADSVTAAPQIAEQITAQAVQARETVLAQPGGDQVIAGLDAAAVELNHAFGPVAGLINQAAMAMSTGVIPA